MYEFIKTVMWLLGAITLACWFIFIGQGIEMQHPESIVIFQISICALSGVLILAIAGWIYEKGIEIGQKEQEPDEDNRRDSTT